MTGASLGQPRKVRRRLSDADQALSARGLLHDLGHQLMTLSLLAESVGADEELTAESRGRMELIQRELSRAIAMITDYVAAEESGYTASGPGPVEMRDLAVQIARLAELAHDSTVRVLPGPPVVVRRSPLVLWRVLSNIIDNAARAAGRDGCVEISVRQEIDTIVDVFDDGPGLGDSPGGLAGLGLAVVHRLLEGAGGRLEIEIGVDGGTRARIVLSGGREYAVLPARRGAWQP
jgi:signal transduction histidine kinase